MTHEFFSDRENGKRELKSEKLNISVYKGLVGLYKKFEKNFSAEYPDYCDDPNGRIFRTNVNLLEAAIKAQIPNIETPIYINQGLSIVLCKLFNKTSPRGEKKIISRNARPVLERKQRTGATSDSNFELVQSIYG